MSHIQSVMSAILNSPVLLIQLEPLLLTQLLFGPGRGQPSVRQFAFGSDPTIQARNLKCAGQTQLFGFNGLGDDRSVFLAPAATNRLFDPRGERPPAGGSGRF